MSQNQSSQRRALNQDAILAGALDDLGALSLLSDLPGELPAAPDPSAFADIALSSEWERSRDHFAELQQQFMSDRAGRTEEEVDIDEMELTIPMSLLEDEVTGAAATQQHQHQHQRSATAGTTATATAATATTAATASRGAVVAAATTRPADPTPATVEAAPASHEPDYEEEEYETYPEQGEEESDVGHDPSSTKDAGASAAGSVPLPPFSMPMGAPGMPGMPPMPHLHAPMHVPGMPPFPMHYAMPGPGQGMMFPPGAPPMMMMPPRGFGPGPMPGMPMHAGVHHPGMMMMMRPPMPMHMHMHHMHMHAAARGAARPPTQGQGPAAGADPLAAAISRATRGRVNEREAAALRPTKRMLAHELSAVVAQMTRPLESLSALDDDYYFTMTQRKAGDVGGAGAAGAGGGAGTSGGSSSSSDGGAGAPVTGPGTLVRSLVVGQGQGGSAGGGALSTGEAYAALVRSRRAQRQGGSLRLREVQRRRAGSTSTGAGAAGAADPATHGGADTATGAADEHAHTLEAEDYDPQVSSTRARRGKGAGADGAGGEEGDEEMEEKLLRARSAAELQRVRHAQAASRSKHWSELFKVLGRSAPPSLVAPRQLVAVLPDHDEDPESATATGPASASAEGAVVTSHHSSGSLSVAAAFGDPWVVCRRDAELAAEATIALRTMDEEDRTMPLPPDAPPRAVHEFQVARAAQRGSLMRQLAFAVGLLPRTPDSALAGAHGARGTAAAAAAAGAGASGYEVDSRRLLRLAQLVKGKRAFSRSLTQLRGEHLEVLLPFVLGHLLFFVCSATSTQDNDAADAEASQAIANALVGANGAAVPTPAMLVGCLRAFVSQQTPHSLPAVLHYKQSADVVEALLSEGQQRCAEVGGDVAEQWASIFTDLQAMAAASER